MWAIAWVLGVVELLRSCLLLLLRFDGNERSWLVLLQNFLTVLGRSLRRLLLRIGTAYCEVLWLWLNVECRFFFELDFRSFERRACTGLGDLISFKCRFTISQKIRDRTFRDSIEFDPWVVSKAKRLLGDGIVRLLRPNQISSGLVLALYCLGRICRSLEEPVRRAW